MVERNGLSGLEAKIVFFLALLLSEAKIFFVYSK